MAVEKKSKKDETLNKNVIVIDPVMKEESGSKIVISFGRMNPPTVGHEKLINKVKEIARNEGAKAEVYLSHTQDAKKNPLTYDDKVMLAREAFGSIVQKIDLKTIIDVMKHISGKYAEVILVVGDDRVTEFNTLLNKYNGKDYSFSSIKVASAGQRDPDAEGVEGMSASKMREAAKNGNEDEFKSGLPKKLQIHADDIYTMVRAGMKLAESSSDLEEYVLSLDQRRKRALVMRRYENKMQMSRERLKQRIASNQKLISRSRKKAIEIIRKMVAGERGLNYHDLSVSDKMAIDKRVEQRKGAIGKIAARMLPKVRQAEMQRVQLLHKTNESFEQFIESDVYHTGLSPSTVSKRKAHFAKGAEMDDNNPAAYTKAPGDAQAKTKPSTHTRRYHMMYNGEGALKYDRRFKAFKHIVRNEEYESDSDLLAMIEEAWDLASQINASATLDEDKSMQGLKDKAEKSGMPYGILKKVFDRGVAAWRTGHRPGTTPQQWAYARVNSFITKSSGTWGKADADLAAKVRSESVNESFAEFINEDKKSFKHELGIGVSLKHIGKDALTHVDVDMDGDVDQDDFKKMVPDETSATPDMTKRFMKKYADEKKHTQKGVAFEQYHVPHNVSAILVPDPEADETGSTKMGVYPRGRLKGSIARADKLKKLRYHESYGAGFEGTDDLVQNFKAATPGEKGALKKPKITDGIKINEAFELMGTLAKWDNTEPANYVKHLTKFLGAPEELTTKRAVWYNKDGFKRIEVLDEFILHSSPSPHYDYVYSYVDLKVPHDLSDDLAKSSESILIDHLKGEVGGRCASLSANAVTIQYVIDVVEGNITPSKVEYEQRIKAMKKMFETGRRFRLDWWPDVTNDTDPQNPYYAEDINEAFELMMEAEEEEITAAKMKDFERFVDRMFEKFKIDFEFTKHFGERMNDARNSPKIRLKELADLIKKIYAKNGNPLKGQAGAELVVKDLQSDLNMPIVVKYDEKNDEIDIVAKTIMRKKNFTTPNEIIKY